MYKKISYIVCLPLMMWLFASCGDSKGDIVFENFKESVLADGADSDSLRNVLADFDGRWEVASSGILPVSLGGKDVSALRDTLYRMSCLKFEDNKLQINLTGELKPLDKQNVTRDDEKVNGGKPGSRLSNILSVDLLTTKIAVFHNFSCSYPEGAAHGTYANTYVNYDIESGKIVTMNAIFTSGFEKLLVPAIRQRLEENGTELLVEPEEIQLPKQFRITTEGVDFIYGLYEIAPYSEGEPKVSFENGELTSILTPTGKALILAPAE